MIQYNSREWLRFIFRFHKSDTSRILLPFMIGLIVYSFFVTWLETDLLNLKYKSTPIVHSLLGFVISLLLVFRTNTAYERWWEGRKLWGSLINNARNLALKLNAFLPAEAKEEKEKLSMLIGNYALALRDHLRNEASVSRLEPTQDEPGLADASHLPNAIAARIFIHIDRCNKNRQLSNEQLILLNPELSSFTDICGACERIKKTPIPYSYSIFLKKFMFIYIVTLPFGLVSDLGYWLVAVVVFMFYVLASLELIAEEIEDPFGKDANDLPTDEIAAKIVSDVRLLMTNGA